MSQFFSQVESVRLVIHFYHTLSYTSHFPLSFLCLSILVIRILFSLTWSGSGSGRSPRRHALQNKISKYLSLCFASPSSLPRLHPSPVWPIYRLSALWYTVLGALLVVFPGLVFSLVCCRRKASAQQTDVRLLSPVVHRWQTNTYKRLDQDIAVNSS